MIENKFAYESIKTVIDKDAPYNDLFILYGQIEQDMVSSSISIIEKKLQKLQISKSLISKAKMLSVEIIQNIFKHQHNAPTLEPYFYMAVCGDGIKLVSGNSISVNDYHFLNDSLSKYNLLTLEELKMLYIEKLSEGEVSADGNAGLGILTIMSRSNKKSTHSLDQISDSEYHFGLEVNISTHN